MIDEDVKCEEATAVNSGEPYDVYDGYRDLYYQLRDTMIENAKLSETTHAQHGLIQRMLTSMVTLRRQVDELEGYNRAQVESIAWLEKREVDLAIQIDHLEAYIDDLKDRSLFDRVLNREPFFYRMREEYFGITPPR